MRADALALKPVADSDRGINVSALARRRLAVAPQPTSPNLRHMQDRLAELRRQRALVAEHLAWIDREIAAAAPADSPLQSSADAPRPAPNLTVNAVSEPPQPVLPINPSQRSDASAPASVPLPSLPESKPAEIQSDVRRGCFIYFALATFLGLAGVALIVWLSQEYKKSHPPKPRVEQTEQP